MGLVEKKYEFKMQSLEPHSVQLVIDLREFCRMAREYLTLKELIEAVPSKASPDELKQFPDAKENFRAEKQKLSNVVDEWRGNLFWEEIKKQLRCSKELAPFLPVLSEAPVDVRLPLLVEILDMCFHELLKNSIDACLEKFLRLIDNPECLNEELEHLGQLVVNVSIKVELDQLIFEMTDNGVGFSQQFLELKEASFVPEEDLDKAAEPRQQISEPTNASFAPEKAEACVMSEKEGNECYLGGKGRGLRIIAHMLRGKKLESSSHVVPLYQVEKGRTSFVFQNSEEGGAQITLKTPCEPFPNVTYESPTELKLPNFLRRKRASSTEQAEPGPSSMKRPNCNN